MPPPPPQLRFVWEDSVAVGAPVLGAGGAMEQECSDKQDLTKKLLSAANDDDVAQVREILGAGAAVNGSDKFGTTALHAGSAKGHLAMASELLKMRAELDAQNNFGTTPLILAAMKGHTELVRMLVAEGAQFNHRDKNGWDSLQLAAHKGHAASVRVLVEAGSEMNLLRPNSTVLHDASGEGQSSVVSELPGLRA